MTPAHDSLTGCKVTLIDFRRPLAQRKRGCVGPYYFFVPPVGGRGTGLNFYMGRFGEMDRHGSSVRLRTEDANNFLRDIRLGQTLGYYCDPFQGETIKPIIARLPRGRGFLSGWTMGDGMASGLEPDIHADEKSAAYAAHSLAEHVADLNRERYGEDEDD